MLRPFGYDLTHIVRVDNSSVQKKSSKYMNTRAVSKISLRLIRRRIFNQINNLSYKIFAIFKFHINAGDISNFVFSTWWNFYRVGSPCG